MKKILVVDDNAENLYFLEVLLKGNGFDVMTATNGLEALESAHRIPPDMIISDILMPVMDGFSLCQKWKNDEQLKHIPFIFYTATYIESKDEKFGLSLGADRFILKPQEPEALIHILEELFEEKRTAKFTSIKPLGEEMEFFKQHNEILFNKLEKKMLDLEIANQKLNEKEEALEKNEEFLNSIIENIPNMIFVKEAETLRFVRFNKAGEELLGQNRHNLIGKNDYDLFPKSQADFFTEKDREVLKNNQLVDIPEEYIQTRQLGERILHTKKIPIAEKGGKAHYLLGISEDITSRKQAEEQIKSSLREKEILLMEIHHRVKNNLNVILGLLDLQYSRIETKEQALTAFQESRDRVYSMALVHRMLYEKTDLSRIDMEHYMYDIFSKLKDIYAPDRGITIESNAKDISLDIIRAIPLGLIINELITNSMKHAFPDNREGHITLSLSLKDTSYHFSVSDDGIGLPKDIRIDAADTLGLKLIRILTEQIDGTLDIQRDKGTRFTITFPCMDTGE